MGATAAVPLVAAVLSGWVAQPPTKVARTEIGAARVGSSAYLVGGFGPRGNATLKTVERYDLRRGATTLVAALPVALNHAPAVAHDGAVYVAGGYAARGAGADAGTRGLLRYQPARNVWSRLRPMPTARGALCAGVIGDRLYAVGGASRGAPLATLEIYDFATGRWSIGPPMGQPREHLACAVAGGRLYALAGRAAGQGNFTTVERFDPGAQRWTRVADMAKPRGGIAAATVRDQIIVLGGEESAGTIKEVEAYDPAADRWSALPDLPTPRHGLGAVAYRGRVYALEGGTSPGFSFSRAVEALVARRASSS
jgi:N-acetylneuraminic acid mutarotase